MKKKTKIILTIGCLIAATCMAMAYASHATRTNTVITNGQTIEKNVISIAGNLVQNKVHAGGNGIVELALTLKAEDILSSDKPNVRHVDMVIVLDRSGSMQGKKLEDAKQAVVNLLSYLTEKDRFSLISYSNDVSTHCQLTPVTATEKEKLSSMVQGIYASGGTNLGGGLQAGIHIFQKTKKVGNMGKLILISDGLANQGITDPTALSKMASSAIQEEFSISTAGVGNDFNEQLMTSLADNGTGTYYYLENPSAFANVFEKEFRNTRAVVASMVEINVPLPAGVSLIYAAGYPIKIQNNHTMFHTGDLLSGQTQKLFLRFQVPTGNKKNYLIQGIGVTYQHDGNPGQAVIVEPFHINCVADPKEAIASVQKREWVQKVLQSDYNQLREEVAVDIKNGDEEKALSRIGQYQMEKESVNEVIGSKRVANNLKNDLHDLRKTVKDTFCGKPAAVATKQKRNAKVLQYESYKGKRQIIAK